MILPGFPSAVQQDTEESKPKPSVPVRETTIHILCRLPGKIQ